MGGFVSSWFEEGTPQYCYYVFVCVCVCVVMDLVGSTSFSPRNNHRRVFIKNCYSSSVAFVCLVCVWHTVCAGMGARACAWRREGGRGRKDTIRLQFSHLVRVCVCHHVCVCVCVSIFENGSQISSWEFPTRDFLFPFVIVFYFLVQMF